jgi:seryl-tRNA synthetase
LIIALLETGVKLGQGGEIEGLELPERLRRFWVGGDEIGQGGKKGLITWR